MIFYQLDYVVEEVLKNRPTKEQVVLRKLTGANFTKKEAEYIWERVVDHKWYIGERLKRDVGERVRPREVVAARKRRRHAGVAVAYGSGGGGELLRRRRRAIVREERDHVREEDLV